jgi:hypothetical protein
MKTAITSASFNGFDKVFKWAEQPADVYRYTEKNFTLRQGMNGHFHSKIPKYFGFQFAPGYDIYIWIDANYEVYAGAVDYLLKELGDNDIAVFNHPYRNELKRSNIKEEAKGLKDHLTHGRYVTRRYKNEYLDELLSELFSDKKYVDDSMFHGAIFIYRNNRVMRKVMKNWWYYVSRYHLDDQLSFPYVLKKSGCKYKVIDKLLPEVPYFKKMNHRKLPDEQFKHNE